MARERSPRHAAGLVVGLVTLLAAVTVALLEWVLDHTESVLAAPWWALPVITVGFAVSEHYAFNVEYRREAISFTLSEVPTAFALVFLAPPVALAARVVGGLIPLLIGPRRPGYKLIFNATLFAFEITLAFAIVRLLLGSNPSAGGPLLLVVSFAAGISTVAGSMAVSAAIASYESGLVQRVRASISTTARVAPIASAVAAVALAPALWGFAYGLLSIAPVVAVWFVMLQHGRLTQHHKYLQTLHGFTSLVSRPVRLADLGPVAVAEARRLLRAGRVWIELRNDDDGTIVTWTDGESDRPLPDREGTSSAARGASSAYGVGLSGRRPLGGGFERIVAPIRDDRGVLGVIIADQRVGAESVFRRRDVENMKVLAEQLAGSVRKTMLHERIEFAARHDALTGDWNRVAFDQLVTRELARTSTSGGAVLLVDLDRFKEINDTLGHRVGDAVLVEFARRVRDVLAPDDVFARFGDTEFAIFARREGAIDFRILANSITSQVLVPVSLEDHEVALSVSVGVAVVGAHDHDASEMVRRADIAVAAAKKAHDDVIFYRREIDRNTPERLALIVDLRQAIDRHDLDVHFQPKIDLGTSTVIGAEALVRWNRPGCGPVPPDRFISIAEETGIIQRITTQVLARSIQTLREWTDRGYDLGVSVNLSTIDLLGARLVERVESKLDEYGVDPGRLTLEITESALMADGPRAMATIERLKKLGIRLSLDDFGTGYSSLSYLRRLPVDELKIDREFVSELLLDSQDQVIVTSTIGLGHSLGLQIVAEGIENLGVSDRLFELGCDLGQGYYYSRPLSADQFDLWLETTDLAVGRIATPDGSSTPAAGELRRRACQPPAAVHS